ncbi:MAG: hypothetical protein A2172_02450 [Candidatus Woykebacteria bacterium RBG_13_40_15]|uniref:Bacterial Ig-like domain-containing protein n=1 Tax=Candidatus Woykebacteria bacterium RBG_13_40_15 TaxID=1802593 RepID=A0A1G1W796_9BACT|nr:MAG: hypothetical protein A2172_02450 [Candidatus Woykebacteria bacterium RBG_13_40_15]
MKTAKLILIFIFTLQFLLIPFVAKPVHAATASLFLSPSYGSHYVGEKFYVMIYVSGDASTNAYEVHIGTSNMTVTGISTGGSICNLYPSPPSYTNSSAFFQCGLPTPGYLGSSGYIGAVVVKGNSPGTGTVSIQGGSKILANDGAGTNIISGLGSASFQILPPPTAAPTVTSSTHPNQDKWYKKSDVSLSWTGAGNNFVYTLDNSPETSPGTGSPTLEKSKTYTGLKDGIWYFHVRVQGSSGWSETTHFRIQIDTTPPLPFKPEADPKENATSPPIIAFAAKDETSGVDHYEIRVDNSAWVVVSAPYKMARISSGEHLIEIKAVDKAGNERIGSVKVTVKEIPSPVITKPTNGSFVPYTDELLIQGHSSPGDSVEIFLDGKKIAKVVADKNGNFEFTYKGLLKRGKHTIYAVAVTPANIESRRSKEVVFALDPQAFVVIGFVIPGVAIFTSLLTAIFIFVLIILLLFFKSRRFKKRLLIILGQLEKEVEKDLETFKVDQKAEKKVEEDFEKVEEEIAGKEKK